MQIDLFLACILISIGAMAAYVADEQIGLTPKLADWLTRVLGSDN